MRNKEATNSNELANRNKPRDQFGGAMTMLAFLGSFGALIVIVYATQSQSLRSFISVAGSGLLVAGASFLVGSLIGFLFGIPKTLQKERPPTENIKEEETLQEKGKGSKLISSYMPNTNLEEISDWLTKILVGVGLTQLITLPTRLQDIGRLLTPAFGDFSSSNVFAIGVFIYFSICGFFVSYLWTRLRLALLQFDADLIAAEEKGREEGEKIGEEQFLRSASRAIVPRGPLERYALWVDDRPENNEGERKLLESLLELKFTNVLSTSEALKEIESDGENYSLVISDMGRPGDPRAGYTLLEELRSRGFQKPFIIYSSSGRPEYDAEARRRGAEGSTNSPQRLLDLVSSALKNKLIK